MRLGFLRAYVFSLSSHRCARMSRTERARASKLSRGPIAAGSRTLSNIRWLSYNAFSVPDNSSGETRYWLWGCPVASESFDVPSLDSVLLPMEGPFANDHGQEGRRSLTR